jgi:hypothetical protein
VRSSGKKCLVAWFSLQGYNLSKAQGRDPRFGFDTDRSLLSTSEKELFDPALNVYIPIKPTKVG